MRILVVEDAEKLARALKSGLEAEGYAVDVLYDGGAARRRFAARRGAPGAGGVEGQLPYDLLILDVMLPGVDGFTLCRELREQGLTLPVLMLTARDATADKVTGLDAGADDYLVKPFAFEELLARIRTLLRRPRRALPPVLTMGDAHARPGGARGQVLRRAAGAQPQGVQPAAPLPAAPGRGAEPRLDPRPRVGRRVRLVLQHRRRVRRPAAAQARPAGRRRAAGDGPRRRLRAARGGADGEAGGDATGGGEADRARQTAARRAGRVAEPARPDVFARARRRLALLFAAHRRRAGRRLERLHVPDGARRHPHGGVGQPTRTRSRSRRSSRARWGRCAGSWSPSTR